MQLDCLLRSLKKNAPVPDLLSVIYKASNDEYKRGYDEISGVNKIEQTDFRQNVLDLLTSDYVMFLCDDDIVFKEMDFVLIEDIACFSYRLGMNIDYCYSNDKPNKIKNVYSKDNGKISWFWNSEELDFGYPLSVTAHLFKTQVIKELLVKISFNNPNEMEMNLQSLSYLLPSVMFSYEDSRIVGVPANKVNDITNNRNGLTHSYTTKSLNDRFLKGERIDFEQMSYPVHSAQQELEYKFDKK